MKTLWVKKLYKWWCEKIEKNYILIILSNASLV